MTFVATNNRIYITNTGGSVVFDTDRQMPAVTSVLTGNIDIPARGPGSGQTTASYYLGAATGNPQFVLSAAIITGSTTYPWVNTMFNSSGSVMTNLGWNYTDTWRLAGARSVTFVVSGGGLYLQEEFYNQFASINLASFSLNYKVYLGRYV